MTTVAERLAASASTICRAWLIERKDGLRIGFTDHDVEITLEGVTCTASSGLVAGALQMTTGLSVDNSEVQGALTHDAISEADLRAGRWDEAEVTSWLVNWSDTREFELISRAHIGEVSWGGGSFSAELRGLTEALNSPNGRVFQERCDATLGDEKCKIDLSDAKISFTAIVDTVVENRLLTVVNPDGFSEDWFTRGNLTMLTGNAAGISVPIKTDRISDQSRELEAWTSFAAPVQTGDQVRVEAGCDKRSETCQNKFSNILNFRGFPSLPGDDWLMAYPTQNSVNDGGRR